MNARIFAVYPYLERYKGITIFGYSSKSVPGLEIVGLGKFGRIFKEKIVYISKLYQVQVPIKRYVLCVENYHADVGSEKQQIEWLELPLLVLYWQLVGRFSLRGIENCFCSGKVRAGGVIQALSLSEDFISKLDIKLTNEGRKLRYLSPTEEISSQNILPISLVQLMAPIPVISGEDTFACKSGRGIDVHNI